MSKVENIERQIRQLSRSEFAELRDWILDRAWEQWDAQIEADASAGGLDEAISESRQDHRTRGSREL